MWLLKRGLVRKNKVLQRLNHSRVNLVGEKTVFPVALVVETARRIALDTE